MRAEATWDTLEKTEIRVERVGVAGANLTELAAAVASTLGLPKDDVLVIDARDDLLALDILRRSIDAYQLVGKREAILNAIGGIEGVTVTDETDLCAEGMFGWLAFDEVEGREALDRSREMMREIDARIRKRAVVFPTGNEVVAGQIVDTNTPLICERLEREGYAVDRRPPLRDDRELIEGALRSSVLDEGYGLVVTTGGVGAETKDCTIEALQGVDSQASVPYICRFEKGHGRHAKDGVRIGVGRAGTGILVSLPGPNDEVELGLEAAIGALGDDREPVKIANAVAGALRERLSEKMRARHGTAS
jgi:molybdenum cofactor synthesis domain-containing protein